MLSELTPKCPINVGWINYLVATRLRVLLNQWSPHLYFKTSVGHANNFKKLLWASIEIYAIFSLNTTQVVVRKSLVRLRENHEVLTHIIFTLSRQLEWSRNVTLDVKIAWVIEDNHAHNYTIKLLKVIVNFNSYILKKRKENV